MIWEYRHVLKSPHPPGVEKGQSDVESAELSRSDPDLLVVGAGQVYVNVQRGATNWMVSAMPKLEV